MWSAYNSVLLNNDSVKPTAEISICPIFSVKSSSPSMVKHAMDITTDTTTFLNPGQTPVLGADQPLYAIAKTLQWSHPDTSIAEDKFVLKMGDLHIEDKAQAMVGKVVRGSGWEYCVSTANVFTSGRSTSVLDEGHIKRTRYAHQVSLVSLNVMFQEAYSDYATDVGVPEAFPIWMAEMKEQWPNFAFWCMVMDSFSVALSGRFAREISNFYLEVLHELCVWFHALDHTHYARWLPVYLRDMHLLATRHPVIYAEFMQGRNFVVQRSQHKFSLMATDQAH